MKPAIECECGNIKTHKRAVGCPECQRLDHERKAAESATGRILSALRWADGWASTADIADASGVNNVNSSSRLSRLVQIGAVDQVRVQGGFVYRLKQRRAA